MQPPARRPTERPGASARLVEHVERDDRAVAADRLQRLLDLQNRIQAEINATLVGRELEVLVTGPGRAAGQLIGRTSCNRIVHFEPGAGAKPAGPGTLEAVRITRALPHSLIGQRVHRATAAAATPETETSTAGPDTASAPVPPTGASVRRSLPILAG